MPQNYMFNYRLSTDSGVTSYLPPKMKLLKTNKVMKCRKSKAEAQSVVTLNRGLFEPDAEAVSKVLEALRNSEDNHMAFFFIL